MIGWINEKITSYCCNYFLFLSSSYADERIQDITETTWRIDTNDDKFTNLLGRRIDLSTYTIDFWPNHKCKKSKEVLVDGQYYGFFDAYEL